MRSEKRCYQIAVRDMLDAAILVDEAGVIEEISPAFEALSGWSEADLVGQPLEWLHWPEADQPADGSRSSTSVAAPASVSMARTHRYRRRDGGFFWGEIALLPLCGDVDASRSSLQIVHDVSARVRREEALLALIAFMAEPSTQGDADLSRLLDLGCRYLGLELGVFCILNGNSDHIEAVGGDLDLMVAGQELSKGHRFSSFLPCDHGTTMIEHAGSPATCMHEFYRQTGLETLLAAAVHGADGCHGTLYFAGRRPRPGLIDDWEKQILQLMARWVAVIRDTEGIKDAAEESHRRVEKSEKRFRMLFEKNPGMMHSIDPSGRLVNVSDVWLATLGYERDEVIGRRSTDFLTSASKRYAENVVLPAFHATGRCDDIEYQAVTKDGDVRDLLLSAIAQEDEHGSFVQSLAILLDVTERKQVERALIEKTAALERSNTDLARFAHIASHDLQEPLRRIIAYSEILKEDYGSELSKGAAEIADIIQSGGRRLRLMINDLLAYVRLSEQLDEGIEPVDMSAVLCHALDDLSDEISSKGVHIDVAHLPLVWGRAPLLKMVLYHLLSNAIKYGGAQAPAIDVSVEEVGDVWQFAVADRGSGVEPRFADRIFEFFQRLHLKDEREGSGAGLAMCRLIIQRCGGDIWLDRSYQDGARFLFTLPKGRSQSLEAISANALPKRVETSSVLD